MKKKLTLLGTFIVVALIAFFLVVNGSVVKTPPDLKVTYDSTEVEVSKFSMGWVKYSKGTLADYPTPDTLAKKINASTLEPETILNLNFSQRPSSIDVALWDKGSKEYKSEDNKIKVPKQSGTYIFTVTGHWLKGQILYVFKVNVK